MADDRHEAYRRMFTHSKIREYLSGMNIYDQASFVYECIQSALDTNKDWHMETVSKIVTQEHENRK